MEVRNREHNARISGSVSRAIVSVNNALIVAIPMQYLVHPETFGWLRIEHRYYVIAIAGLLNVCLCLIVPRPYFARFAVLFLIISYLATFDIFFYYQFEFSASKPSSLLFFISMLSLSLLALRHFSNFNAHLTNVDRTFLVSSSFFGILIFWP